MNTKGKLDLSAVNRRYKERIEKEKAVKKGRTSGHLYIAALLLEFTLPFLRELFEQLFEGQLKKEQEDELLKSSSRSRYSGKLILLESVRVQIWQELDREKELLPLYKRMPGREENPFHKLLGACLKGEKVDLFQLDLQQLKTLLSLTEWLSKTSFSENPPPARSIRSRINQERLFAYFNKQTRYFAGREKELQALKDYIDPFREKPPSKEEQLPLLVYGIGGIGKSTLIAEFILRLWRHREGPGLPFVYLDFDKITIKQSEYEPFNPLILAEEAFRQLAIQFPSEEGQENPLNEIRLAIKDYFEQFEEPEMKTAQRGLSSEFSRQNLYDFIRRRYIQDKQMEQLHAMNRAVLVVLDSFEEFQNVANSTEFYELQSFLNEVREIVPELVIVIAGRTDYFSTSFSYQPFFIGPFDKEASLGFLKGKGIHERVQQIRIAEKAGGIPLALSLLANLVLNKEKEILKKEIKNFDWDKFYKEVDQEHLNEQLVIRNVEHISEEVRGLGIPGIIVRKITPEIIQKVLAIPCKLGPIDENQAHELFNRLMQEVFLLEEFEGELHFRRDLRESIHSLIKKKYGEVVQKIHELAIKFYENKEDPSDRAEYLYHRLMLGGGNGVIDEFYSADLRIYLERSLWEFEETQRVYLYSKMGKLMGAEELARAPQKEWELYLITRIQEVFQNRAGSGFGEVGKLLEERSSRSDNSPLLPWEAQYYSRQAQFDRVENIYQALPRPSVKVALAMALEQELEFKWQEALDILSPYADKSFQWESLNDLTSWGFTLLRLLKRRQSIAQEGTRFTIPGAGSRHSEKIDVKELLHRIARAYSLFDEQKNPFLQQLDEEDWEVAIRNHLPATYAEWTISRKKLYFEAFDDGDRFQTYLKSLFDHFLTGEEIKQLSMRILNRFPVQEDEKAARQEMGLFLDNRFRLFLEEVTEPGAMAVVTYEFACFLEQAYLGELKTMLKELGGNRAKEIEQSYVSPRVPDKDSKNEEDPAVDLSTEEKEKERNAQAQVKIRELIAQGDIDQALEFLVDLIQDSGDEQLMNDGILLSSRYNRSEKSFLKGLITYEEYSMERSKLVFTILNLASDVSKGSGYSEKEESAEAQRIPPAPWNTEREQIIKKLVGNAEIKESINELMDLLFEIGEEAYINEGITISSNYHFLEDARKKGILPYDSQNFEVTKVSRNILSFLSNLKEDYQH
jgi:hypothetical protein